MNESINILMPFLSLDDRNMAIFIGLYLSRFNRLALEAFEFTGFHQAYNVLGYALNIKPKSINNYRDEFDPYFPNGRKGWNREMKPQSKVIFELAKDLTFEQFTFVIKAHLSHTEVEWSDIQLPSEHYHEKREFSAERLITGKAAEEYFVQKCPSIEVFSGFHITNTTDLGCGFDFKLSKGMERYYVEVKGMNAKTGNILMTEKEHRVAEELKNRYCLFVVKDFRQSPFHDYYFDPLHSDALLFERHERQIIQTTFTGKFK